MSTFRENKVQFSIKIWRHYYDHTMRLGKLLKDARSDNEGNPAVAPLSKDIRDNLEIEISKITHTCRHYLDCCGMKSPEPLWLYNRDDPKTWASHESFAYQHLMEF